VQRYNKKCTFARKSRESLLSGAIFLQMGCIERPYFRGGTRNAGGAIEGTTVSLNARVQPAHSRFSRESLLSGAIYCDFWLFLYKNTLRYACYKNIQK
jgi:hypothetical protein